MANSPDEEPTDTPTRNREQAEEEGAWMGQNWLRIAVVSILGLWVVALGLLQASGLINVFAPIADTQRGQWAAFAVLALVVIGIGAWSWFSPRSHRGD
ncbi:opsin family protein [Halobacteria archaeon AArc-m2/3/4]|uniref:Opsin family protein n=1 Tax=Natronoglomus mannanivorans TaxID=2979990 RepID=A0AAP3E161_9EURY|nr:opsin family protein [Halobacteria archaeon AArc-xg1-1]MCU4972432.1 opsin family protein [Halobacteria archaeon AArc-m2/3/4]